MNLHTRTGTPSETYLAWEVALDRLELDLIMAERFLESGQPPAPEEWDMPQVGGPLPASLLPRALDIQRRQAAIEVALREALTANGRHRDFTDRVSTKSVNGLVAPAYVDLSA
jgi:hypothetical protein